MDKNEKMENKLAFEVPTMEIVEFEASDVIVTSDPEPEPP